MLRKATLFEGNCSWLKSQVDLIFYNLSVLFSFHLDHDLTANFPSSLVSNDVSFFFFLADKNKIWYYQVLDIITSFNVFIALNLFFSQSFDHSWSAIHYNPLTSWWFPFTPLLNPSHCSLPPTAFHLAFLEFILLCPQKICTWVTHAESLRFFSMTSYLIDTFINKWF